MSDRTANVYGICPKCNREGGEHFGGCFYREHKDRPRRFRIAVEKHPAGSVSRWAYGCYFPLTDLCINDMGGRGTGEPQGVEWIDQ